MSELERLASACIFPGFPGHEAPPWLERELDAGLGGVVLFAWNVHDPAQLSRLTAQIRKAKPDAVVAIDEEGGDVTRLEAARGSSFPGNAALGAVDDPSLTQQVARAIGGELRAVGVNLDLAPVADLCTTPANPIVGVRSFGSDPHLVARHVSAFVTGLQSAGVGGCAKHFPGHGATAEDSHLGLPQVDVSREELVTRELVPFRAAVDAGVAAVLTAHIRVPSVDDAPATLSARHIQGLLREELGFDGVVMTDALEMHAISRGIGVQDGAVSALAAGADALCLGHDLGEEAVPAVRKAIVDAVRRGDVHEDRLTGAAERIRALTRRFRGGDAPAVPSSVGLDAARRAIRVEGQPGLGSAPLVVELVPEPSIAAGPALHGLGAILGEALPETEVVRLESGASTPVPGAEARPIVLVLRDAHRDAWQQELASNLVATRTVAVVVETGLPLWAPPGSPPYVATFGAGRANLVAAAEVLTGLPLRRELP